jgi:hypothetical protein
MRYGVDIATAAIILAQILSDAPMPEAAMAEGGHAQRHQPIVVGERGPEVFVPDVSGTVVAAQPPAMTVLPPGAPMKADPRLVPASATDYYDALERNGLRLNDGARPERQEVSTCVRGLKAPQRSYSSPLASNRRLGAPSGSILLSSRSNF